jgi:hypothetical protein
MAQKMTEIGGVPRFFAYTGTATSGPAAVAVTTPKGFLPTYIRLHDGTATSPNIYEWFYGMPAASYIKTSGAHADSGKTSYGSTNGFTVVAGTVTLGTSVLAASVVYKMAAFMAGGEGPGGVPLFYSASGISAATEAHVHLSTPKGFYPDWVRVYDDYDATTPASADWHKAGVNPSAILTSGATGAKDGTTSTTNGITVSSGEIIIGTDTQLNDGNYVVFAGRFSQIGHTNIGGCPITYAASGTAAATSVTLAPPDSYDPDWVMCVVAAEAAVPTPVTEWILGYADPGASLTTGSTGTITLLTSTGINPGAGSIVLGTGCITNGATYTMYSARYSK